MCYINIKIGLYFVADFGDEANKKARKEDKNPEEKKQNIKALIDKIPTDKDALFEYEIDWEMVDSVRTTTIINALLVALRTMYIYFSL